MRRQKKNPKTQSKFQDFFPKCRTATRKARSQKQVHRSLKTESTYCFTINIEPFTHGLKSILHDQRNCAFFCGSHVYQKVSAFRYRVSKLSQEILQICQSKIWLLNLSAIEQIFKVATRSTWQSNHQNIRLCNWVISL